MCSLFRACLYMLLKKLMMLPLWLLKWKLRLMLKKEKLRRGEWERSNVIFMPIKYRYCSWFFFVEFSWISLSSFKFKFHNLSNCTKEQIDLMSFLWREEGGCVWDKSLWKFPELSFNSFISFSHIFSMN